MKLTKTTAEIFCPSGEAADTALKRTARLAISAHQDDIEIMAADGIFSCWATPNAAFGGVVVTNGAGSARSGIYEKYTDAEMMDVRRAEQKKAAVVGNYSVQALLDYSSGEVKDGKNKEVTADIASIIAASSAKIIYTHNLADKHETHCAVVLRVIAAIRSLPKEKRPDRLYGCEVWRDLDWMLDEEKTVFDLSGHDNLSAALLGVFDSQIAGGKRYDLAAEGRRTAHATYYASHSVDNADKLSYAMDLSPLINNVQDPCEYALGYIERLKSSVASTLKKLS
ncbi:MAG: PIG-L family deacetylase [Clostridiales bacterium]|jgi:LmbE family N-acetylglucosaminyl deacetylase|nr:PIG-L family deacetylase [Clostridiales bacterium]